MAYKLEYMEIEFSQNFNVEILENLESVKTTPETNYKIFFKDKYSRALLQGDFKYILKNFTACLQVEKSPN